MVVQRMSRTWTREPPRPNRKTRFRTGDRRHQPRRSRNYMVQFGGYGFAPVAMVFSFVADNCDRQKRSGNNKLPLPITPKFPKAARTEGLRWHSSIWTSPKLTRGLACHLTKCSR